jgi:hypothetical protein
MAQLKAAKTVRVGLTSTDNKPVEFSFDIPGIAEAITGVGF